MSGPLRTCVGQKGEEGLAGGRVQVTHGTGLGPEFQDRPPGAPPTREHHPPRCTPGHVRSCRDHEGRDLGSPERNHGPALGEMLTHHPTLRPLTGDNGTSPVWLPKSLRNRKVP